jgi:hypothetical protein
MSPSSRVSSGAGSSSFAAGLQQTISIAKNKTLKSNVVFISIMPPFIFF